MREGKKVGDTWQVSFTIDQFGVPPRLDCENSMPGWVKYYTWKYELGSTAAQLSQDSFFFLHIELNPTQD